MGTFDKLSDDIRAAFFEFVGTTLFLLLGLGGIQSAIDSSSSSPSVETLLYISTCMGLSLLISVWLFFRITGGVFNPNVTLSLLLIGAINPIRFVLYTVAQLVGGIAASGLLLALLPGSKVAADLNTSLGPGVNHAQGVFIEMFATSALVFSVLMLAAEKHAATPFAPVGVGLTLFAGHLFCAHYTGAAMNTARAFGPAVVAGFPHSSHWVYWLGPYLGSFLGAGLYLIVKRAHYSRLNPGQDSSDPEKSPRVWGEVSSEALSVPIGNEGDLKLAN